MSGIDITSLSFTKLQELKYEISQEEQKFKADYKSDEDIIEFTTPDEDLAIKTNNNRLSVANNNLFTDENMAIRLQNEESKRIFEDPKIKELISKSSAKTTVLNRKNPLSNSTLIPRSLTILTQGLVIQQAKEELRLKKEVHHAKGLQIQELEKKEMMIPDIKPEEDVVETFSLFDEPESSIPPPLLWRKKVKVSQRNPSKTSLN
jgi:hypothetical protein